MRLLNEYIDENREKEREKEKSKQTTFQGGASPWTPLRYAAMNSTNNSNLNFLGFPKQINYMPGTNNNQQNQTTNNTEEDNVYPQKEEKDETEKGAKTMEDVMNNYKPGIMNLIEKSGNGISARSLLQKSGGIKSFNSSAPQQSKPLENLKFDSPTTTSNNVPLKSFEQSKVYSGLWVPSTRYSNESNTQNNLSTNKPMNNTDIFGLKKKSGTTSDFDKVAASRGLNNRLSYRVGMIGRNRPLRHQFLEKRNSFNTNSEIVLIDRKIYTIQCCL